MTALCVPRRLLEMASRAWWTMLGGALEMCGGRSVSPQAVLCRRCEREPWSPPQGGQILTYGPITVDLCTGSVEVGGVPVPHVPSKLYWLLVYLLLNPERLIPYSELEEKVLHGRRASVTHRITVHRLRGLLGPARHFIRTSLDGPASCGLFSEEAFRKCNTDLRTDHDRRLLEADLVQTHTR